MTEWFGPGTKPQAPQGGKTYRILIVDDDVEVLRSLTHTVRRSTRLPTDIVAEASPERGVQHLRTGSFDLVISDYRMPKMTGVELLAQAAGIQPGCRRILITGYREENIAQEAVQQGRVHGYLLKPWSTRFLGDHIREVLTAPAPKVLELHEALALLHKAEGMV